MWLECWFAVSSGPSSETSVNKLFTLAVRQLLLVVMPNIGVFLGELVLCEVIIHPCISLCLLLLLLVLLLSMVV